MSRFQFSNFQDAEVFLDGILCPTVEHAYQAAKTSDEEWRTKIIDALTPGKAKRLGRKVPLRDDWEEVKLEVMEDFLRQKFAPGTHHAVNLRQSRGSITEFNRWHDNYWGDCTCDRCDLIKGENHLGRLLVKIRVELEDD